MTDLRGKSKGRRAVIDGVGITPDTLTSRGGLTLFVRYIEKIGMLARLSLVFGFLRKSRKGQEIGEIFKQILCFFVDGTSPHLTRFDDLKKDPGYADGIQSVFESLVSSHAVKRFFSAFHWGLSWAFRDLLLKLFLWRLQITKPKVILLGIDTMVMDNDEAKKREGVQPTYKRVKGFHPLQMTWEAHVIDAVFRGGKKHGNHGDTVAKMVKRVVKAIRSTYDEDVLIIIRIDSGFLDEDLFELFDDLKVGFTCSGKMFEDIKSYADAVDRSAWSRYQKGPRVWEFFEMGDRRGTWKKFRRAIFTRLDDEDDQRLLEFARMEGLIYTNLGMGGLGDERVMAAGKGDWLTSEGIVELHHGRGKDELVNKWLKEFRREALPFKRFSCNTAFYSTMVLAMSLFESFKQDVCADVVGQEAFPTTIRRKVIDFAAKIARSGGRTVLKVTQAVWNELHIQTLWARSGAATLFCPA